MQTLSTLQGALAPLGSDAEQAALKRLAAIVQREALVLAFSDVFVALTALFAMIAVLTLFLRRPDQPAPAQ